MKIGVLLKQVPGSESTLRINSTEDWIEEDSVNFEMNESDSYALEEALQIIEKNDSGGEVVVLSMGPDRTQKIIREALAKGAHRGIHIQENPPFETDPFVVSGIFSKIVTEENFDLLLCGLQSDDLNTGQTGVILGTMNEMSTATLVMATELTGDKIRVKRELESGWYQWVTLPLPAALTIQSGINQPRYASLKGIMGAKKKEIKSFDKTDLMSGIEALQRMEKIYVQKKDKQTEMIEGNADQMVDRLVEILKNDVKVL
jgi:electron transfer flavoprotein beta subunit